MMCLLEIACLVFGVIILAKGKVPLSAKKEVRGAPAYIVACLLLAVFPLAFGLGFIIGFRRAQRGQQMNFGQIDWSLVLIEFSIVVGCVLAALVVALVSAKPKRRKRRYLRDGDYDDYYDGDDDYGEVRSRKRLDEIEDEEDEYGWREERDSGSRRRQRSLDDDYDQSRRDDF